MPKLASAAALLFSLVGLASACGGNSFSSGHSSGASDTGGTSSAAGEANVAGKTAHGGSGGAVTAGSSNGGESSSGTASGGGSTIDEACSGPATMGAPSCSAAFSYWTHDAERGICVPIIYGGCGGTKNLYKTLAECQDACSDSSPSYDSCSVSTDCALGSPGCCGVCDSPNVTAHDFIAYNRKYAASVNTCGDVACGACPNFEGESTLKYIFPNCVAGRCVVEDLRTSSITACEAQTDCTVRPGRGCCPSCGGGDDMFAIRNDGSFEELVCGDQHLPCPACVPAVTGKAICGPAGHCVMEYPASGSSD